MVFTAFGLAEMTMASNSVAFGIHREKTYGWVESRNGWVITWLDDAGLCNAIRQEAGKDIRIQKNDGFTYRYWVVDNAHFGNIRNLLDALGYRSFGQPEAKPQQASAAASPVSQSPVTVVPFRASSPVVADVSEARPSKSKGAKVYSVSEINTAFKEALRKHLSTEVWVEGDIVDFKYSESGKGYYFQLAEKINKDETAPVKSARDSKKDSYIVDCIIWNNTWPRIISGLSEADRNKICNGTRVRMRGHFDSYVYTNRPSLYISEIDLFFEEGEFYKEKMIIESRLQEQGILANNRNLPMPFLPLRLAVFSNESSAGWGDFIKKIHESMFPFEITIFPTALQGKMLEPTMMRAFEKLEQTGYEHFDFGLILRGGGATRDLYDFNNYRIAEFIVRCPLKFLVGVGHDRDTTVLDDITSVDLITPTDVAVYIVKLISDIDNRLETARENLPLYTNRNLERMRSRLSLLGEQSKSLAQAGLHRAERMLDGFRKTIENDVKDSLKSRSYTLQKYRSDLETIATMKRNEMQNQLKSMRQSLNYGFEQNCDRCRRQHESYKSTIETLCDGVINRERTKLQNYTVRLNESAGEGIRNAGKKVAQYKEMLNLLRPDEILKRGFVTVSDKSGHRVTDIAQIKANDSLSICFVNGRADVTVDKIAQKE